MCILSLINKFSAISAQILFTLHKSSKIHHTLYLHSTNSPYHSINRWIGFFYFLEKIYMLSRRRCDEIPLGI